MPPILGSIWRGLFLIAAIDGVVYGFSNDSNTARNLAIASTVGVVLLVLGVAEDYRQSSDDQAFNLIRGRGVLSKEDATTESVRALPAGDEGITWGNVKLASTAFLTNALALGSPGAGKSVAFRMLQAEVLPRITPGSGKRALILDTKLDQIPVIASMRLSCRHRLLQPFDFRGVEWRLRDDITTAAAGAEFANTLVPTDPKETQPFFSNAVRSLASSVITTFIRRELDWTLRDLLLVMQSRQLMRQVLSLDPANENIIENFLSCGDVALGSIMATVASKLSPFAPIAAAWQHATKSISIKEFLATESVLVLGLDERNRYTLSKIHQLFLSNLATQLLSLPDCDSPTPDNWFFLDEFNEAGAFGANGGSLPSILLRGRSKSAAVVLGLQDVDSLKALYGDRASSILGSTGQKLFLRLESPESAKYAVNCVGANESWVTTRSEGYAYNGNSETISTTKQVKQLLESEFMGLPSTDFSRNGMTGVAIAKAIGAYRFHYTPDELNARLPRIHTDTPAFVPAPISWQYLEPWSDEDARRLGLDEDTDMPIDSPSSTPLPTLRSIDI